MIETYEYLIKDQKNEKFTLNIKVDYDTENEYNTTYYFPDGEKWIKDFIDIDTLSPEDEKEKELFQEFITKIHDYMVHGNLNDQLRAMEDEEVIIKNNYELVLNAKKI